MNLTVATQGIYIGLLSVNIAKNFVDKDYSYTQILLLDICVRKLTNEYISWKKSSAFI